MEDYIIFLGDTMAKPIASTPILEGEDVIDLINYMKRPLTKKEKEFNKRVKNAKKSLEFNLGDFNLFNTLIHENRCCLISFCFSF